jgi:hypothetical protein
MKGEILHAEMMADLRGRPVTSDYIKAGKYLAALLEIKRLTAMVMMEDADGVKHIEGVACESPIKLGDDGVFRCSACPRLREFIAERDREIDSLRKEMAGLGRSEPADDEDGGNPAISYIVDNHVRVRVAFQDGSELEGEITSADWDRIVDGKLQTFILLNNMGSERPTKRAVRWWSVKFVELR